ncbi:MAG: hypothetical protein IJU33_07240 [Bacteroidales bacterium]|nr:hypothetical protein [Bacteroidales bacterium]
MKFISLAALAICLGMLLYHFIRIVRLGKPKDLSEPSGSVAKGVVYANTTAMMPQNKESAYMHLPTYTMGIIFHIGIFTSILLYFISFTPLLDMWPLFWKIIGCCLAISGICGLTLFIKRCINKNLKVMSNLDDYLSNMLTTLFQLMTALLLWFHDSTLVSTLYYIEVSLLLLYIPQGKLKHMLYYFAARYHLGFFYGWRNVWPKREN